MRFLNINPLDQIPAPATPVILVHTQSFLQDITSGEAEIMRLIKIATLKTCPIVFTPVIDPVVQATLSKQELDVAHYYLQNNRYIVRCRYLEAEFSAETDPAFLKRFEDERGYSLNDSMLMGSGYFHFHVSKTAPRSISLDTLLDILQVYHIKNGIFKTEANASIGQFIYDMVATNKQIPAYKKLMIEFLHTKSFYESNVDTIDNLLQSLHDRMMLMNKSVIELKYQSLRTVTNNASSEIMYHFSYLVILVTGTFDNLAWMINYLYNMKFSFEGKDHKMVKLQNVYAPQKKITEPFYRGILSKAPEVCAFLLSDNISCLIDFIYPLRDAIQHRSFIKPLFASGNMKSDNLLIWFPDKVNEILERHFRPEDFGFDSQTSDMMNRHYYDVYIFSKKLHEEIINLVNTVCTLIDMTTVVPISQEQTQAIDRSMQSFQNNPWVGLKAQRAMAY